MAHQVSPSVCRSLQSSPRIKSAATGLAIGLAGIALAGVGSFPAWGQAVVFTSSAPIDRRYTQIEPTNVSLPANQIDARGHQDILRALESEQGFAMRPLPRGKKGLTLVANGKLMPAGEGYLNMITEKGLSVKPGDRCVMSSIRIEKDKIVFDINGGPEHKHEFLRHIQIGMDPSMTRPMTSDPDQEPTGARVTLTFSKVVPDLTPAQVKALLAPLISFDVKTPVQAFTDTLPPKLKEAILAHHVMVGMSTEMVLFALGQPEAKSREVDGQTPFEEWIYGHPPQDVNFVRINGNRVIRVEVAKLGQPLAIFTTDEVDGLMRTDGRPVVAQNGSRPIQLGDVQRDAKTQSPNAPPTLRKDGEKLPSDDPNMQVGREGAMKPVIFPKDTTKDPSPLDASQLPRDPNAAKQADEDEDRPANPAVLTAPAASGAAAPAAATPAGPGSVAPPAEAAPATPPASQPKQFLPAGSAMPATKP